MSRFNLKVVQGDGIAYILAASGGTFTGSETLLCDVWPGGTQAVTFQPSVAWSNSSQGKFTVTFTAANTATVAPGYYFCKVYVSDASEALAYGFISIYASVGTSTADLVTVPYAHAALADSGLADTQLDFLPTAISFASDAVRQWCHRWFTRRTLTREFVPSYDGRVLLPEMPINEITRVACDKSLALTVSNTSSSNQQARCYFATTGDRTSGLTITGLTLVSVSSGVSTTNTLLFATYTTISSLATAIAALGSGWSATVNNSLGSWGTDQIVGGDTGQGCLVGQGGLLYVYASDASDYSMDWGTGMVYLGTSGSPASLDNPAWGPGWMTTLDYPTQPQRVQITYDAGYDTIPAAVQQATCEVARQALLRLATDETLRSESAEGYSYTLGNPIEALTLAARQMLAQYRITNA